MVKHIVLFKLKGESSERRAKASEFRDALLRLPSEIDVLDSIEVALNENPSEDWDLALTAVVPTMADVDVYAKHPAHVAAASIIAGYKDSRACVDYEF